MKRKQIILTTLIALLIFGGSFCVHARLFSNTTEDAFDDGDPGTSAGLSAVNHSYSIRELVIKGAGHFLKGQSYINIFSEQVELSDIKGTNFYSLRVSVNNAQDSMYYAWYYYQELQTKAAATPYKQVVIGKLESFDYDAFQKEHGLIKDVFQDVKKYLIKGDVRGVYTRTSRDICKIYFLLEDVKTALYKWVIPDNSTMWNLNQECAKTLLFGQYVARVFEEIK